jgi:hypothetical protein
MMEEPVPPEDTGTILGLTVGAGPAGDTEWDKDTVLENPLTLPKLKVVVADEPAAIIRELGLALIAKSTTITVMMTE